MVSTFPSAATLDLSQVRLEIRAMQDQLVQWRRILHQRPELGFQEHLTAAFISEKLQSWGVKHETGVARTGIVATIEGRKPGPVLAIRADMDALPIQEQNQEVPYRSQHQGLMHACGHDGHTAIALGTAKYLAAHPSAAGVVKIIFQPAEEGPGGAKPMIEAGVLENPPTDAIIGLHLWNNLPLGTVAVRSGPVMAASDFFKCTIFGKGGHGAIPHQTVDSILVAAQAVQALQTIVSRNLDPLDAAVVTVGQLHAGTAKNVIAHKAELSGTVRYFKPELFLQIRERFEQIIAGVCQAHGATYELDYLNVYPPVINDEAIATLIRSCAAEVVETPSNILLEYQTMGSEDMSFFLQEVPGCYFFLGSANPSKNLVYPHHHPRFDFDESILSMGVEIFVRCTEKFCK